MFGDQGTFGNSFDNVIDQLDQISAGTIAESVQKLEENETYHGGSTHGAFVPEIAVKEHDKLPIL